MSAWVCPGCEQPFALGIDEGEPFLRCRCGSGLTPEAVKAIEALIADLAAALAREETKTKALEKAVRECPTCHGKGRFLPGRGDPATEHLGTEGPVDCGSIGDSAIVRAKRSPIGSIDRLVELLDKVASLPDASLLALLDGASLDWVRRPHADDP